jgi:acid stress chaperone HdeA
MKLKHLVLPLVIAAVSGTAIAADAKKTAAQKPVAKWTCAEFLAVDDEFKPKVVYAATAYSREGKPEEGVIDIEGTETVTPMVIEECEKAPKDSFWKKLKGEWKKVKAATKSEMKKIEEKM